MQITIEAPARSARRGRAARLLLNVVCTLVSLVAIGFILPAAFGLDRYVIAGGSMTGSISRGSVVFDEVVPVADLAVGDVITYLPPADSGIENLVTHRIVSIDGDTYRTKGDANADADPWTFELTSATQARVAQHVPYLGYPILALQDRSTRMAVIGLPAALVALWSLRELLGALRRRPASPDTAPDRAPGPAEDELPEPARELTRLIPTQAGPADAGSPRPATRRPVHQPTRTSETLRG